MTCHELHDWLHECLDRRARWESHAQAKEHLDGCPACRDWVAAAETCIHQVELTRPCPPVPPQFADRVIAAWSQSKLERSTRFTGLPSPGWLALAAGFLLCLGLGLLWARWTAAPAARSSPHVAQNTSPFKTPPWNDVRWAEWLAEAKSFEVVGPKGLQTTMTLTSEYTGKVSRWLPDLDRSQLLPTPDWQESLEPVKKVGSTLVATLEPVTASAERAIDSLKKMLPSPSQ